ITCGKCCITEVIGAGTTCPKPHMEVMRIAWNNSSHNCLSSGWDSPDDQADRMVTNFCEPTRHGTHLPHDSLRKKRTEFKAMSSMQRLSAQTTMAPEPTIEPASATALKSKGKSSIEAGRYPEDGPEGANASRVMPSITPSAYLKIRSRYEVPMGTSKTPGCTTSPLMPTNFSPVDPFTPWALNHSTPRASMAAVKVKVSTLLITVGRFHNPFVPGKGGLLRGSARLPSNASSSALSSPQIYPPGLTKISRSKVRPLPNMSVPKIRSR